MKKAICILLTMAFVLGLCACSASGGASDDGTLQAGFARVACLPDEESVHIEGGDAASDISDGVLDELAETCVALKQGGETVLIYTCDIVDIDAAFYKTTEAAIAEATGIDAEHIIINATHDHSAPTLKKNFPGRDTYLAKFNKACADAGVKAIADLSPATLSYGSIMTENMVFVRHYLMNDGTSYGNGHGSTASGFKEHLYPSDGECQVLRFTRAAEDKKDIVMMNLGAHATIASGEKYTTMLSADFPGYVRQYVEENAGVHCAYFIAAAGDQTPGSKVGLSPYGTEPSAYGEHLGEYVLQCLEAMTDATADDMQLYSETYTAKRMKDGTDDANRIAQASEVMAIYKQNGNSYNNPAVQAKIAEYGFASYYEASAIVSRSSSPESGSFPTATMTLGTDVGIVFFPGEMFSSQGRQLKDNSPMGMTFVITCSEDDQGYYPNETAKEHYFYEYQITKYEMGTGEAVADRYCEILTALKEGTTPAPLAAAE